MYAKRSQEIDIMKGIGIILVVLGHVGIRGSHFIYLFHMSLFFLTAGYCFNEKDVMHIGSLFKKRMRSLWIPSAVYNSCLILLNNVLLKLNLYTDNSDFLTYFDFGNKYGIRHAYSWKTMAIGVFKSFLFQGGQEATWFLLSLFYVTMAYALVTRCIIEVLKTKQLYTGRRVQWIRRSLSIILLAIGGLLCWRSVNLPLALSNVFSCFILFDIGHNIKTYSLFSRFDSLRINLTLFLTGLVGLLILNNYGTIDVGANRIVNPLYFMACSLLGFGMVYACSCFVVKWNLLRNVLCYIGKNTLPILLLHFWGFKVITAIQVKIFQLPQFELAAFPTLYINNIWWILYLLAGVCLPLLVNFAWYLLKNRFLKPKVECGEIIR